MTDLKKKDFVKPKLVKFDKPLDKVTLCHSGTGDYSDKTFTFSWWR